MTAISLAPKMRAWRQPSVLPGFGLTLGLTLAYLGLIVLIPLGALFWQTVGISWDALRAEVTSPRTLAAFRISFGVAALAALVNAVFGLLVSWVLVRYTFPGRRLVDAMIDLPFALPTSVAGIALTALYSDTGWIGGLLAPLGIRVAYTPFGILVALIFVGLPFVVRTVEPVLRDLDSDLEEAAALLGARRLRIVIRVVLPPLFPALLTGATLAFARAVGEYGSVIFISSNMPGVSEIVPLLIVVKLEQFDYAGAAVVAALMLIASFTLLFVINLIQAWTRRRHGG
jgi:sulfate transport system permease protein